MSRDFHLRPAPEPTDTVPSPQLPMLLVSVRSLEEAAVAMDAGVDIIDFKEPNDGALAPVDPQVWRDALSILTAHHASAGLSAALGESSAAIESALEVPAEFTFAKVGPAKLQSATELRDIWRKTRRNLCELVELVAVAYADYEAAETLAPAEIFSLAAALGIQRVLIDTYIKDGQSTVKHLGIDGLQRLNKIANDRDLWWALGGAIDLCDVESTKQAEVIPNCYAVRGAVCDGERTSNLSLELVGQWVGLVATRPNS